jgi:Flp pilus assembly secretin CpaC
MGASSQRSAGAQRRRQAFVLAFAVMASAVAMRSAVADTLTVVLDQAQIMTLPDRVGTIVVGNPLIADVSLQAGGTLVITGRGYGTTNIIALDRTGATLMTKSVLVVGPRDNVVVYRGVDRESYSCAPRCERRITLGDAPASVEGSRGTR